MLVYHHATITGADLRACRKAANLTQAGLASRAGFARDAVSYWEGKDRVPLRSGAPAAFAKVLGLPEKGGIWHQYARAGGWGLMPSAPFDLSAAIEAQIAAALARARGREAQRRARVRVKCGAKTRKGGACLNKSEPGKRRCKFHGGKSTGPRTPEGKARIAEAQRARWEKLLLGKRQALLTDGA